MRTWFSRSPRARSRVTGSYDAPNDVFQQPNQSLLGEAFSRPLGVGASVGLVLAVVVFLVNHWILGWNKLDDYALVAFFVAGGVLLSLLLRIGEPTAERNRRTKTRKAMAEPGLVPEDNIVFEPRPETAEQQGLAEPASFSTPVPPGASAVDDVIEENRDDELEGYQRALVHFAEKGDLHGQGEILRRLGHLAKSRGHLKESQEFYVNARSRFRDINDSYAEAAVLLDLGQVLESLGDQDAAGAAYREANRALLDVAMDNGNRNAPFLAHAAD